MRVASPVRRADQRNPPVEKLAGRSGPTLHLYRNQGGVAVFGVHHGCVFQEDSRLQDERHDGHSDVH